MLAVTKHLSGGEWEAALGLIGLTLGLGLSAAGLGIWCGCRFDHWSVPDVFYFTTRRVLPTTP